MQHNQKIVKATLCALLSGVMAFSVTIPPTHAEESVLELQAQYDKLEAEIKKNKEKLQQKEQDKSDQKAVVSEIESEIGDLSSQITILDKKIELLNGEIGDLTNSINTLDHDMQTLTEQIAAARVNIADSQKQIETTRQKVLDRYTKSYMAGAASPLELLLGAKSLADVLSWEQYIQNAADYDKRMMDDLQADIAALQEMEVQLDTAVTEMNDKKAQAQQQKADLEIKQADAASSADTLNIKKNTANSKRNEAYALLRTLNQESEEFKILDEQMRAEEERIDAEMNARLAKVASVREDPVPVTTAPPETTTAPPTTTTTAPDASTTTTARDKQSADEEPYEDKTETTTTETTTATTTQAQTIAPSSGGTTTSPRELGLICPIQNPHAYVSGTYPYYRSGGVHHGIDIVVTDEGKTLGHDIVAPQSGKVITIGYGDASRGNYMEIDHGNGLVTRYYHCSTLLVSMGQTVSKGQVVAKVGATGNATGPHLHFEVLVNTASNGPIRQNPLDYITVP